MHRRTALHTLPITLMAASGLAPLAAHSQHATTRLLARLRQGGLTVFFRHSLTQRAGQPDTDLSTCVGQRNLTEAGRALASDIGLAFRELQIPVGTVRASPYCRCVDTARLAFGTVQVADFLETNGELSDPGEQQRLAMLASLLARGPANPGSNTVYVAHGNNLQGLSQHHGYPPLGIAEAEAVVFGPQPGQMATVLGRVPGSSWRLLA